MTRNQETKHTNYRKRPTENIDFGLISLKMSVINMSSRNYIIKWRISEESRNIPFLESNRKYRTDKFSLLKDQWACLTAG